MLHVPTESSGNSTLEKNRSPQIHGAECSAATCSAPCGDVIPSALVTSLLQQPIAHIPAELQNSNTNNTEPYAQISLPPAEFTWNKAPTFTDYLPFQDSLPLKHLNSPCIPCQTIISTNYLNPTSGHTCEALTFLLRC